MKKKEKYISVTKVAEILGTSRTTVYNYIDKGVLPYSDWHQGRTSPFQRKRVRITKTDFDLFFKKISVKNKQKKC